MTDTVTGRSRAISDLDGDRLRYWRKNVRMLSQAELATAAGMSRGEISHLETGKRKPLATTLRRLCVALECGPENLLTGAIEENGYAERQDISAEGHQGAAAAQ